MCCEKQSDSNLDIELRGMIDRLRERRNALRTGDGFGNAGTLIGAYKRTILKLEELASLVETLPLETEPRSVDLEEIKLQHNLNCLGAGSDNVPGCDCRVVFEQARQKKL